MKTKQRPGSPARPAGRRLYLRPIQDLSDEIAEMKEHIGKLEEMRDLQIKLALIQSGNDPAGLLGEIVRHACAVRNLPPARVYLRCREREVCETRFLIFYLARRHSELSLTRLGDHFGMDHGAVLHGARRAAVMAETDRQFARDLIRAQDALQSGMAGKETNQSK